MDNSWVYFQRRRIAIAPRDHVSTYAAKHPQEDFAEVFRFYVTRRGRLRDLFAEFGQKRKGVILYEKFLVLQDFVRALRGWAKPWRLTTTPRTSSASSCRPTGPPSPRSARSPR
jgi:hypothetical protein